MIRHVAILACDNGLGHVRRQLQVARALARSGIEVTVLAPRTSVARIATGDVDDLIRFDHFETATSAKNLRDGVRATLQWDERLPPLDRFDLVISDNLPEILARRSDAVLMGNFFWHEAISDCHPAYADRARRLLTELRPPMIASRIFAAPYLESCTRLNLVGLFRAFPAFDPLTPKTDLLVVIGLGGEMDPRAKAFVRNIAVERRPPFTRILIEPSLMPEDAPPWIVQADFTADMFSRVAASVCRPTVGILTDLLLAGARPFMFGAGGNNELAFNADSVAMAGLGDGAETPEKAYELAVAYSANAAAREAQIQVCRGLDDHGAEAAAELIRSASSSRVAR